MKATDEQILAAYHRFGSVWKAAEHLGMCGQSVHERLARMGASKPVRVVTDEERQIIRERYQEHANNGTVHILASEMGRTRHFLSRVARSMGLTNGNRKRPYIAKVVSENTKAWLQNNDHPRGMLGKTHSAETRRVLSASGRARNLLISDDEISARITKSLRTKLMNGVLNVPRVNTTWKAGWREIGGVRKFYRSRWEANYARYLQWLKEKNQIQDWQHEPETFWFENIKRGARTYLPDFRVVEMDGAVVFHEVKGWMDSKSKTKLRRMKKYYPAVKIVLVQKKQYEAICRKVSSLIGGWE